MLAALSDGLALVTVSMSVEFYAESHAFDTVEIEMSLVELSGNRITMGFDYRRVRPDGAPAELIARGRQTVAVMGQVDGQLQPAPVPADLAAALAVYRRPAAGCGSDDGPVSSAAGGWVPPSPALPPPRAAACCSPDGHPARRPPPPPAYRGPSPPTSASSSNGPHSSCSPFRSVRRAGADRDPGAGPGPSAPGRHQSRPSVARRCRPARRGHLIAAAAPRLARRQGAEHRARGDGRRAALRRAAGLLPLAGDDAGAKGVAGALLSRLGFAPIDVGGLEHARELESLAVLLQAVNQRHGVHGRIGLHICGPDGPVRSLHTPAVPGVRLPADHPSRRNHVRSRPGSSPGSHRRRDTAGPHVRGPRFAVAGAVAGVLLAVAWSFTFVDSVIGDNIANSLLGHDAKATAIGGSVAGLAFAFVSSSPARSPPATSPRSGWSRRSPGETTRSGLRGLLAPWAGSPPAAWLSR
ncbi:thioesterase family protein [Micromonospora sp. BRA006-A]|nr:thioesterase family protein [Micromonospora sp. BRA006-A]